MRDRADVGRHICVIAVRVTGRRGAAFASHEACCLAVPPPDNDNMDDPRLSSLVLCKSVHHGNTARVAGAISRVLSCAVRDPAEVPSDLPDGCGLLGIGSGVYYGRMHPALFAWLRGLPDASTGPPPAFIFSTSGLPFLADLWHRPLRRLLARKGFEVIAEFACRGFDTWGPLWLTGGLNRTHPDEHDLERAGAFAEKLRDACSR